MSSTTRSRVFGTTIIAALASGSALAQVINETHKLLPADGDRNDMFGYSIDIDDSIVAVGSRQDIHNSIRSGSAYLFDVQTGGQLHKLVPDDIAAEDGCGFGLGISGGIVVTGSAWDDDQGSASGSAAVFDAATGAQLNKLLPSDGNQFAGFGMSLAVNNGTVASAARQDDDNGANSGSAYVFALGPAGPCNDADMSEPFGLLDLDDINTFVAGFLAGDPVSDIDGNGLFDLQDVLAFGAAFTGGCP